MLLLASETSRDLSKNSLRLAEGPSPPHSHGQEGIRQVSHPEIRHQRWLNANSSPTTAPYNDPRHQVEVSGQAPPVHRPK